MSSQSFDEHEEETDKEGKETFDASLEVEAEDLVTLRLKSDKSRSDLEAKRRSLYQKDCKGRSKELASCKECQDVALEVKDIQLNEEIFHIPSPPVQRKLNTRESVKGGSLCNTDLIKTCEDIVVQGYEDDSTKFNLPLPDQELEITNQETNVTEAIKTRRFKSVKSLLERARQKLLVLQNRGSRDSSPSSQSSPATPGRKSDKKSSRNRSFSPIRSLLNSPLLGRRRKNHKKNENMDETATSSQTCSAKPMNFSN